VTLERSVSTSEAARFTVLAFAFEVQIGSPSKQGALAGTRMRYTEFIGATALAFLSGCYCNPAHNMALSAHKCCLDGSSDVTFTSLCWELTSL